MARYKNGLHPIYLEPFLYSEATKARSTEAEVWNVVIKDLSDCIAETNLPAKYAKGNASYGRVTKGAAYALRGKVYMYLGKWAEAAADFANVAASNVEINKVPSEVMDFKRVCKVSIKPY